MKILRHKWFTFAFGKSRCIICGCEKHKINFTHYFYFDKYGRQLPWMPLCKLTFLNDQL